MIFDVADTKGISISISGSQTNKPPIRFLNNKTIRSENHKETRKEVRKEIRKEETIYIKTISTPLIKHIPINSVNSVNSVTSVTSVKTVTCNCKNSQCLKLYCECFSSGGYCDPSVCSCKGCSNTTGNESLRSEKVEYYFRKNPKAFRKLQNASELQGCTCKKSNCMKRYCECYQNNKKCGSNCKCTNCKNSDGEHTCHSGSKSSNSSTRTSSFSVNMERKLVPCIIIINNYTINEHFILNDSSL